MPTFRYDAVYAGGEKASGVVEARSREDAVTQIRQTCEMVISIKEVPKTFTVPMKGSGGKVTAKSLAFTCQQFSIILKAGMPLVQTVELVANQTEDKTMAGILRQVAEDVAGGWSLGYSLDQRAQKFPVTFRETVRAGEESGDLVAAFQRMARYYDRVAKTTAKALSTLTYPAFVIGVAVIVVGIIMIYAVPAFTNTFASMGLELPLPTRILIGTSNFMTKYFVLIIASLVLIGLGVWIYSRTEEGALKLSRMSLGIPVVGEIGRMAGASQFSHTMAAMLAAGMPILQAIEISGRAMTNKAMSREVQNTIPGVESGSNFAVCMAGCKELPQMLVQMTAIGESSGSLESTLGVLAEYYDNEVSVRTDRAMALLEPIIICVLAVFVVCILMAVYLPLFSMYGGI